MLLINPLYGENNTKLPASRWIAGIAKVEMPRTTIRLKGWNRFFLLNTDTTLDKLN